MDIELQPIINTVTLIFLILSIVSGIQALNAASLEKNLRERLSEKKMALSKKISFFGMAPFYLIVPLSFLIGFKISFTGTIVGFLLWLLAHKKIKQSLYNFFISLHET